MFLVYTENVSLFLKWIFGYKVVLLQKMRKEEINFKLYESDKKDSEKSSHTNTHTHLYVFFKLCDHKPFTRNKIKLD